MEISSPVITQGEENIEKIVNGMRFIFVFPRAESRSVLRDSFFGRSCVKSKRTMAANTVEFDAVRATTNLVNDHILKRLHIYHRIT